MSKSITSGSLKKKSTLMDGLKNVELSVLIISLVVVGLVVIGLALYPEQGTNAANTMFNGITANFGSGFLWFGFLSFIAVLILANSKFGEIRLGREKPEYSTMSWISMMICAGIGSATVYWAFNEWAFYYDKPPFGIMSRSTEAAEWAISYNMFHWGLTAWALYAITSLPVAYAYHVRKSGGLKLSSICEGIFGEKLARGPLGKLIDIIFIFGAIGGLGITLGLSIPLVSGGLSEITGIADTFKLQVIVVLAISVIYSFSSYIGLSKGMKLISDFNIYLVGAFLLFVLVVGPTKFIIANTTNSLGLMLQNYVKMSLWTDPINKSGFPESWTIFYWAYWLTYTPFMGLFITKISRGRTIKAAIYNMLFAGSAGTFAFFGILGNYSLHTQLSGKVDAYDHMSKAVGASMAIMKTLPMSSVMIAVFIVVTTLFLSTTLDSAAFTLASTTTKELPRGGDPSPFLRLFWCVVLSLVPLAMMFIGAPLKTIQTSALVVTVPLVAILICMIVMLFKWMNQDFGSKEVSEIVKENKIFED